MLHWNIANVVCKRTSNLTVTGNQKYGIDSPYLLSFVIDIYEEELESGTASSKTLSKAQEVRAKEATKNKLWAKNKLK